MRPPPPTGPAYPPSHSCNSACTQAANSTLGSCIANAYYTSCSASCGGSSVCIASCAYIAGTFGTAYQLGTNFGGGSGCNGCGHAKAGKYCEAALNPSTGE